jgi:predicted acetyltransferase
MITLRTLLEKDKSEFLKSNMEDWEDGFAYAHYFESIADCNFENYVSILPGFSKGEKLPKGHVPCTFLFAFNEKEEIVGRVSIRHSLTENLLRVGGHVGYGVVPSHRKQGHATLILSESIKYIKNNIKDLDKILVTCDENNIGSKKTIERNNGLLENKVLLPNNVTKLRYWIEI